MKRLSGKTCLRALLMGGLSVGLLGACSSAPPPPPKPVLKVAEPPPPPPAPPPLPPSRWVRAGGATAIGPRLEAGTLVLLGGRRALIGKDQLVRAETVAAPEPLEELIEVPLASGGKRLVARSARGLYRLDEPLGALVPLATSEQELRGIGAYPGHVVVWTYGGDMPRFLDVETGRTKTIAALPPLPMRAVAFRDAKEGAAIFDGIGLATTTDGGASWKRVSEEVAGDALRVMNVELRDGALRAFIYDDGRDAPVDAVQARLFRIADPTPPKEGAPLERWVRATRRDPLAVAAQSGVLLPGGDALIASHGMIARVDTRNGLITSATEFAHGLGVGACSLGRAGGDAWVACALTPDSEGDLYDPFGVMRVPLDGKELRIEKPALVRNGEVELRASPSGGVMLLGPCSSDDEGDVCVRQPNGRWATMRGEVDLFPRGAGPMSDGRVAFMRNMWESDVPDAERMGEPDEVAEQEQGIDEEGKAHREDAEEAEIPERQRVYVATLSPDGKEKRLASLMFRTSGELRVLSPIEEDADHTLHFVIADDEGVYAALVSPDAPPRAPSRLEGATSARIRGGRGIAVGEETISASTDGGRVWQSVPLPEGIRSTLGDTAALLDDPNTFGASEVGVLLDRNVRIGWGAAEASEERAAPVFDVTIPPVMATTSPLPDRILQCNSEASVQGTPPLLSSSSIAQLLGKKAAPPKGTRRATSTAPAARNGLLDVVAFLEEEGPDKPGAAPNKWTLSWHDAAELGGKPRSVTGAPPKEIVAYGAQLRSAAGSSARALFTLRAGTKNLLVRTKGAGFEIAEVGYDLLPSGEIVFGTEKGDPIAWFRDTALVVWVSGEAPRIIGHVGSKSSRSLGEPTKDGIPVLVSAYDWAAMRVFPIPVLDKKATTPAAPKAPTLEGWTIAPNIRQHLSKLPPCAAKPKSAQRFFLSRGFGRVTIDGTNGSLSSAIYDVRLTGPDACIAQLWTLLTPDRGGSRFSPPPPPPTKGAKPAAPKAPLGFARVDFLGKRAEGGERGMPGKDMVRKVSCTLDEKK